MNLTHSSQWVTFAHHTQTTFISAETISETYVTNIKHRSYLIGNVFVYVEFNSKDMDTHFVKDWFIYWQTCTIRTSWYWRHQLGQILGSPSKVG